MRAQEFITEVFDKPYKGHWEKSDYGRDLLVKLPDGSNLSVMFNLDHGAYGDEEWSVEFWRNNSQDVTGAGDQQRIFATVLSAIKKFIDNEHPERIRFTANKDVTPGQKSSSRTNLYNRLVQRYANSWGYDVDIDDFADTTVYNLHAMYEDVAEGLNESAYEEAWELISQPVIEIQQFVQQLGLSKDDATAKQIAPMINAAPDTQIPAASIPKLKNLANKGNDVQTLKAIQQISGRPDAAQQYAKLMQARDAGEGRNRGYDVSGLIKSVQSGNYEAPVLLKLPTGLYVIGGRTRLYAALALGIPAKVKIISANNFKQGVAENFADGKNPGRKGLAKRMGVNCKLPVSKLRSIAKNSSGERARMAHWCANMKSGKKKK